MTSTSAKDVVDRYNQALAKKDFAAARALLADGLRFQGPIDRFDNADDYVAAITRLYGMVKGVQHQATIVEGDDVAFPSTAATLSTVPRPGVSYSSNSTPRSRIVASRSSTSNAMCVCVPDGLPDDSKSERHRHRRRSGARPAAPPKARDRAFRCRSVWRDRDPAPATGWLHGRR